MQYKINNLIQRKLFIVKINRDITVFKCSRLERNSLVLRSVFLREAVQNRRTGKRRTRQREAQIKEHMFCGQHGG